MDMKVEYFLACSRSVLLEYADSIRFGGFFGGEGDSFDDSVQMREKFLWNLKNCFVMFLRYNESVSFTERSCVDEGKHGFIFIHDAGMSLFSNYPAEDARVLVHAVHPEALFRYSFLGVMQQFICYARA